MAQQDLSEKYFEESSDTAADFFNAIIYDGRPVINPEDLEPTSTVGHFISDSEKKVRENLRDIANYRLKENKVYSIVGIENQTRVDKLMYSRVANYNGTVYGVQLRTSLKKTIPVITIVAYFGLNEWNPETDFYKYLGISEEEARFIDKIKLNLVPMAFLTDEQIAKFHGDFKHVALSLRGIRENKMYVPKLSEINHLDGFIYLMVSLSDDVNYMQRLKEASEDEKGDRATMTNAQLMLKELQDKGRAEGRAEERKKQEKAILLLINSLREQKMSDDLISQIISETYGMTKEETTKLLSK